MAPGQGYLAQYNSYVLPGYVQSEAFETTLTIGDHQTPFADGSLSEWVKLENKMLNLRLKVWECDYATAKKEVQHAATLLRSRRDDFAPLYLQESDKYYVAMTKAINVNKVADTSIRTREYTVDFECKPWRIHDVVQSISGTNTVSTNSVGRTIEDGSWTPTVITVTGTNVTVSGYTDTIPYTGFISIDGSVTNMIINSEDYTAEIGGVNANDRMLWAGYETYVGPGKTTFDISGASSCTIEYRNRWEI